MMTLIIILISHLDRVGIKSVIVYAVYLEIVGHHRCYNHDGSKNGQE